jgi:hypothetical protein
MWQALYLYDEVAYRTASDFLGQMPRKQRSRTFPSPAWSFLSLMAGAFYRAHSRFSFLLTD